MVDVKLAALLLCLILPVNALAQDRDFTLSAPAEIVQSGILQHLLPRFSLKHNLRITQVPEGGDVVIGAEGVPVFAGLGTVWHITQSDAEGPALFVDWLLSDIGKRTIAGFQPDGAALFTPEVIVAVAAPALRIEGDPVKGEVLAVQHCGRCHVVNDTNRMDGMGQAPSFAGLRAMSDWQNRFATFYVLNPHPSFTQVADVTPAFPANLPPAIVPVEVTLEEVEAILAYAATVAPADLGAPLQSQ
jgi:mono/diheme cytochrome c family protein